MLTQTAVNQVLAAFSRAAAWRGNGMRRRGRYGFPSGRPLRFFSAFPFPFFLFADFFPGRCRFMPVRFAIFLFLSIRVFHSPERIFRFPVRSVRFSWMDATGFHDRFCGMTVFSFGFHCLSFRFFFMFSANVFINRMVCFCVFFMLVRFCVSVLSANRFGFV